MIRIFATTACVLSIAIAVPAYAQSAQVDANGTVSIGGTGGAGSPGTVADPYAPLQPAKPHHVYHAPLLHDGLYAPGTPSINAVNHPNGTMGQEGVSGVTGVRGVRPVGSAPLNQHVGVDRP